MPVPKVWTERNTNGTAWTHCTWCAILEVIVGSGFTAFPHGIYTEAERKAFVGNSTVLNFSGGVQRAKERYGLTVVSPTPMSEAQLKAALAIPNRVWAIAGKLSNYPTGHRLRRWQPGFLDTHAVGLAVDAAAKLTWLDPLAPNLYGGDAVTVAEALLFRKGNYPSDARYMTMAATGGPTVPFIPTAEFDHIVNRKSSLKVQAAMKAEPVATSATLRTYAAGTGFYPVASAKDGQWLCCWLYDDSPAGYTMGYFPVASCTALVVNENPTDATPPSGFTQADIDAAVDEATKARDEDWRASIIEAVHPEDPA